MMGELQSSETFHSFGEWLRRRRKVLDLTQAQLALRVGCTAAMIRKIEADERMPSLQLAELLATALRVPDGTRTAFLQAARQVQAAIRLPSPIQTPSAVSLFSTPPNKPTRNLPVARTSLVSRLRDVTTLVGLVARADVRLLTLLGPPGIGKTRLCIHTAETVAEHFRDGVWFVDLAPITDASLVLPAIAHIFSVVEASLPPLREHLCATLVDKQLLLILDNFEQVSEAATEVSGLLRACKGLKILVTSRVPLYLTGEHEYVVPPLSLPPLEISLDIALDELMSYEAVQLFVARVRQHQHNFAITPANALQIGNICIKLDGMPLALELAAAVLRHMTVSQLGAMLHDEAKWLHALQSPARDLPPRQRTLYHAIAWSYSLLHTNSQVVFRQLGVFVGGFTAEAAQTICGADQPTLALLTDHSLLAYMSERWRMLEMIREFALAQMSPGEHTVAQQGHAGYFASQADMNLDAVAHDYDNFRTALAWAIDSHNTQAALLLCLKLSWFWETRGYLHEGLILARATLAMPDAANTRLRIDVLERVSILAWQVHQFDVAMQYAEQITTLAHSNGRKEELACSLNVKGRIYIEQGDHQRAEAALRESIQLAHQVPHLFSPGRPLAQLGELALARGDLETAAVYLGQAITLLAGEEEGLAVGIYVAIARTALAEIALAHDNHAQVRHELSLVLPYARLHVRRLHCLLVTLAGLLLASLHATRVEDAQTAAEFLGAVAGVCERTGASLSPMYQVLIAQRGDCAQQILTQPEWQAAWQVGHSWTPVQAVEEAEYWLAMDFQA